MLLYETGETRFHRFCRKKRGLKLIALSDVRLRQIGVRSSGHRQIGLSRIVRLNHQAVERTSHYNPRVDSSLAEGGKTGTCSYLFNCVVYRVLPTAESFSRLNKQMKRVVGALETISTLLTWL